MAFPNIYNHRKVADSAARACDICYKQSTSVLITPDNKDFFYVCPSHLKDRKFCSPIIDEAAVAAKKKKQEEAEKERQMKEEVEKLKKEYEEKQSKKNKVKAKDKAKEKTEEAAPGEDKAKNVEAEADVPEEEPRVFELGRIWFQHRLDKKRQAEAAKRQAEQSRLNQERLRKADFFPAVPKDLPGNG